MRYASLGSTGLKVSRIGLGTWTFGWTVDRSTAARLLSTAADMGCDLIDTADRYGRPTSAVGTAETFIGEWLTSRSRDRSIIATKVRGRMGDGPNDEGLSRSYLFRAVDASLRRLRTDYIDLYQIHWPDPATPLEETLQALDDLRRAGKIRYVGCCNFSAWLLCKSLWQSDMHDWARCETLQLQYSLVHRAEYERELMHLCADQRLGVLAYSPLAEGYLTGKYRPGMSADPRARRAARPEMEALFTERNEGVVDALRSLAASSGHPAAALALAWVLRRPGVSAALIGAREPAQLEVNLGAADIDLAEADLAQLTAASMWPDDRTPLAIPAATR